MSKFAAERDSGSWWSSPELHRVWGVLAIRMEARGLEARGRVRVEAVSRAERRALSDLLGRPVAQDRVMVDLAALDDRLRQRTGLGLVEAAERVCRRPLVDRPARQAERSERRESPYGAAHAWLEIHPALQVGWVDEWLAGLRRDGVLMRAKDSDALVVRALELLWDRRSRLLDDQRPSEPVTRSVLAARLVGDAHAFDPDRRLTAVVLRALAARLGVEVPADTRGRRDLWESAGVVPDGVSSTCLTWGVRWREAGDGAAGEPAARASGAPRHVTWWDLGAGLAPVGAQMVLVVENPSVLEAVARLAPPRLAVVCTSGWPNLVTSEVLSRLVGAGSRLRYHGDFDWPGLAMANAAVAQWGATPWLMGADDYLAAPATLALSGADVEPVWSAELGEAMRQRGLAVHEEAVLDAVLAELWG